MIKLQKFEMQSYKEFDCKFDLILFLPCFVIYYYSKGWWTSKAYDLFSLAKQNDACVLDLSEKREREENSLLLWPPSDLPQNLFFLLPFSCLSCEPHQLTLCRMPHRPTLLTCGICHEFTLLQSAFDRTLHWLPVWRATHSLAGKSEIDSARNRWPKLTPIMFFTFWSVSTPNIVINNTRLISFSSSQRS